MVYVARTKENLEHCKCLDCPSYTLGCKIKNTPINLYKLMDDLDKTEHFEGMYCAFEKSTCISDSKGCLCYECEIYHKYRLNKRDFCLANGGLPMFPTSSPNTQKEKRINPI